MLINSNILIQKCLHSFGVIFVLTLFSLKFGESFVINNNQCKISDFSNQNVASKNYKFVNTKDLGCTNRINAINSTHQLNEVLNGVNTNNVGNESEIPQNILALLCSNSTQIELLNTLNNYISQNNTTIKMILYITSSEYQLSQVVDSLRKSNIENVVNIIRPGLTRLYTDSSLTLANSSTLSEYYNQWIGGTLNNNNGTTLELNGELVTPGNICSFNELLNSFMKSYFMDNDGIEGLEYAKRPAISLDKRFLMSSKTWIDNNYVEPNDIFDQVKKVERKNNLIMVDDFSFKFDVQSDRLKYEFKDNLLAALNRNCIFIGVSRYLYNPQHVTNWLRTLFGKVRVVSMSKSPKFKLLTSYGSLDVFTEGAETYASKFNGLETSKIKEYYKYFTKKSNLARLTNTNPKVKEIVVKVIKEALNYLGIDSYHKLIRSSTKAKEFFKRYIRELRKDAEFIRSDDRIEYMLKYIMDVPNNNTLSKLVRTLGLNLLIRQQQKPTFENLVKYIETQNLYPTVICEFDGRQMQYYKLRKQIEKYLYDRKEFINSNNINNGSSSSGNGSGNYDVDIAMGNGRDELDDDFISELDSLKNIDEYRKKLIERGICLYYSDNEEYVKFVKSNLNKFKIIISNEVIQSAPHYIFLDSHIKSSKIQSALSNDQIYSYTQGADLVTFTMDMAYMFHNLKSLVSPIYFNLSKMEHSKYKFNKHDEKLSQGLFSTYLSECKREYSEGSPSTFEMMESKDKLEEYLESEDVDKNKLVQLNNKIKQFKERMETLSHSILSKLLFKSRLINKIAKRLRMGRLTILGVDDREYRVICIGYNPHCFLSFKDRDLEKRFKNWKKTTSQYAILEDVERHDYLVTENTFIKDIIKLEGPDKFKAEPLVVENMTSDTITSENDLKQYLDVKDISINYISLNGNVKLSNPKLSSLLPKQMCKTIYRDIADYEENTKQMKYIMNKGRNRADLNEEKNTHDKDYLKVICEDFVKLNKKLRNVSLERVIRDHQFKSSFWGK